jgi:hypothetical protein
MGFEGWRLSGQSLSREGNSTGLGMALGMTDTIHSSKTNLMKIVDVYTHAQEHKNTNENGDPIEIGVNFKALFLKEMRRLVESDIKSLNLKEIGKIYKFLPLFEIDDREDIEEITSSLKTEAFQFLMGEKAGSVKLQDLNEFLNQFAIWEMQSDLEEYKMLLQGIEQGKQHLILGLNLTLSRPAKLEDQTE